jgi:hypothetical protein
MINRRLARLVILLSAISFLSTTAGAADQAGDAQSAAGPTQSHQTETFGGLTSDQRRTPSPLPERMSSSDPDSWASRSPYVQMSGPTWDGITPVVSGLLSTIDPQRHCGLTTDLPALLSAMTPAQRGALRSQIANWSALHLDAMARTRQNPGAAFGNLPARMLREFSEEDLTRWAVEYSCMVARGSVDVERAQAIFYSIFPDLGPPDQAASNILEGRFVLFLSPVRIDTRYQGYRREFIAGNGRPSIFSFDEPMQLWRPGALGFGNYVVCRWSIREASVSNGAGHRTEPAQWTPESGPYDFRTIRQNIYVEGNRSTSRSIILDNLEVSLVQQGLSAEERRSAGCDVLSQRAPSPPLTLAAVRNMRGELTRTEPARPITRVPPRIANASVPNLNWVRDEGNLSIWQASARVCVRVVMQTPHGNTTYIDTWMNSGDNISVRFGDGIASC